MTCTINGQDVTAHVDALSIQDRGSSWSLRIDTTGEKAIRMAEELPGDCAIEVVSGGRKVSGAGKVHDLILNVNEEGEVGTVFIYGPGPLTKGSV